MRIEDIVAVFIEKHQQQGKSIARIAKETGVNSNTLNNWKYNKSIPSLPDALKMAKWLGVELDAPEMILGQFQPRSAVEVIKELTEERDALRGQVVSEIRQAQENILTAIRSLREEVLDMKDGATPGTAQPSASATDKPEGGRKRKSSK
jgi:transcriptional regulator with XRE-family HTH domain